LSDDDLNTDAIFDLAVEGGADDVIVGEGDVEIIAPVDRFKIISDALRKAGYSPDEAQVRFLPNAEVELDSEQTIKVMRVIEELEDMDDVQNVFSNLSVSEEAVAMLETV
jgi:transcriptional/translational regulatory protein YebC/TACO1